MKPVGWPPAIVLAIGAVLATAGVRTQRALPLRAPLAASVVDTIGDYAGSDMEIAPEILEAVGVNNYLSRVFERRDTTGADPSYFTLYVGYYEKQTSGKTIHSPRNCLPGGGWEPLTNKVETIQTASGPMQVNRYLIQNGRRQALVLYWYQGRGRVASNEYAVKWDLVRDAALRRRSEEALVRIVVPVQGSESAAFAVASRAAARIVAGVGHALPA